MFVRLGSRNFEHMAFGLQRGIHSSMSGQRYSKVRMEFAGSVYDAKLGWSSTAAARFILWCISMGDLGLRRRYQGDRGQRAETEIPKEIDYKEHRYIYILESFRFIESLYPQIGKSGTHPTLRAFFSQRSRHVRNPAPLNAIITCICLL